MDYEMIVNKENRLSRDYKPKNLVKIEPKVKGNVDPNRKIYINEEVLELWLLLVEDAKKEGYEFYISSCYRSYDYQRELFDYYLKKEGLFKTLSRVALPGTSEHQTGLAFDYFFVRDEKNHYDMAEDDPEYIWIKENAHKYGFIIRYPRGKEDITGYTYEPWHLRFVGEAANYIHDNNITLEEYVNKKAKKMLKV